jgi:AAA domain
MSPPPPVSGDDPQPRLATLRDLAAIVRAIQRVEARLVIFDPFNAYIDAETNSYRDSDVRRLLAPLARIAQVTRAAFLFIRHPNKAIGTPALYRGGGSIGIIGAARSGLVAGRDPASPPGESRGALASVKNNLSAQVPSLAYQIVADASGLPVVRCWRIRRRGATLSRSDPSWDARHWLEQTLVDGPRLEEDVRLEAEEESISYATLRRAKKAVGVLSRPAGYQGRQHWLLPAEDAPASRVAGAAGEAE